MSSTATGDRPQPLSRQAPVRGLFYGWVMLGVSMLALFASGPAQTFGLGVFAPHIQEALGISPGMLSLAFSAGTLLAALPMGYLGAIMDRLGVRKTLLGVSFLFGATCMAMGLVNGVVALFFGFLMMRLLGQGALGLCSANTLPFWFERRLGTVEGIRHLGFAAALGVIPPLNLWLIGAVGWRMAFVCLGLGVWAIMALVLILFRNRPEEVGQAKDGDRVKHIDTEAAHAHDLAVSYTLRQAMCTGAFWGLVSSVALWACLNTSIMFHIVPLLEARGLTSSEAAVLFPIFAVSLAVMHVVGGYLADRLPFNAMLAGAVMCMIGVFGLFAFVHQSWMVYPAGLLMGVTQGTLVAVISPATPRFFGRAHIGKIRGVMATIFVSSTSVGPVILGYGVELIGSYTPLLIGYFFAPMPLVVLALWAVPRNADGMAGDPRNDPETTIT